MKLSDKYDFWTEKALKALTDHATLKLYNKGDIILNPESGNMSVYLIEFGTVEMRYYTPEGNAVTVLRKGPGDMFGIKGVFQYKIEKKFYVIASADVKCWKIQRRDFLWLLENDFEFTKCAFEWFSTYIDVIQRKMLNSAFLSTHQKIVLLLLEMAEMTGENTGVVNIMQKEIADTLATTRQTVNAYLSLLEETGLISVKRGQIIVNDVEALKDEAV